MNSKQTLERISKKIIIAHNCRINIINCVKNFYIFRISCCSKFASDPHFIFVPWSCSFFHLTSQSKVPNLTKWTKSSRIDILRNAEVFKRSSRTVSRAAPQKNLRQNWMYQLHRFLSFLQFNVTHPKGSSQHDTFWWVTWSEGQYAWFLRCRCFVYLCTLLCSTHILIPVSGYQITKKTSHKVDPIAPSPSSNSSGILLRSSHRKGYCTCGAGSPRFLFLVVESSKLLSRRELSYGWWSPLWKSSRNHMKSPTNRTMLISWGPFFKKPIKSWRLRWDEVAWGRVNNMTGQGDDASANFSI